MEGFRYSVQGRVLEISDVGLRVRTLDEQEGWISRAVVLRVVSPKDQDTYETTPDRGL
jgi:hypothetical protein